VRGGAENAGWRIIFAPADFDRNPGFSGAGDVVTLAAATPKGSSPLLDRILN